MRHLHGKAASSCGRRPLGRLALLTHMVRLLVHATGGVRYHGKPEAALQMPSFALQPCTFKVDYTLPIAPGMEFGSVFIGDQPENLAVTVVAAGWARVSIAASALCSVISGP